MILQNQTRYDTDVEENWEDEVVDKRYYMSKQVIVY